MGVGWALSYIYNDVSILYIAVIISVAMNVVAFWKSDSVVMAMSGAHKIERESARDIYVLVENLCITAGLPMPAIYIIEDQSANAFATGRDPKHAAIALTTGIIKKLEKTELEGVIAHELSHIKNYDTLIMTVVVVLVGVLTIISDIFLRSMWFGGNRGNNREEGGNPIMAIIGIVGIILAPIAGSLIQLAISRKREFVADTSAGLLTRYPEGLASALEKISKDAPMQHPRQATAHLFIANPYKADVAEKAEKVSFFAKLFMTHPPIQERIAVLRGENK